MDSSRTPELYRSAYNLDAQYRSKLFIDSKLFILIHRMRIIISNKVDRYIPRVCIPPKSLKFVLISGAKSQYELVGVSHTEAWPNGRDNQAGKLMRMPCDTV